VAERRRGVAAVDFVFAHLKDDFGHGGEFAEAGAGFNSRVRVGDISRASS
jgi:hypothetical protein